MKKRFAFGSIGVTEKEFRKAVRNNNVRNEHADEFQDFEIKDGCALYEMMTVPRGGDTVVTGEISITVEQIYMRDDILVLLSIDRHDMHGGARPQTHLLPIFTFRVFVFDALNEAGFNYAIRGEHLRRIGRD